MDDGVGGNDDDDGDYDDDDDDEDDEVEKHTSSAAAGREGRLGQAPPLSDSAPAGWGRRSALCFSFPIFVFVTSSIFICPAGRTLCFQMMFQIFTQQEEGQVNHMSFQVHAWHICVFFVYNY